MNAPSWSIPRPPRLRGLINIRAGLPAPAWRLTAQAGRLLRASLRRFVQRREPAALLVLCLGVAISFATLLTVQSLYRAEAQTAFEGPAAQVAGAVSQGLTRHLEVVEAAATFFAASREVDRWAFFEFARDTLPRFPGVAVLAWVPAVAAQARPDFEQLARDDGLFGFHFSDLGADGRRQPAAARDIHFPLYYLEPFEGTEEQLGLDLAGRPEDLRLLLQARDSGAAVIARRAAAGAGRAGPELVVVQPIYRGGKVPETREARRAAFIGLARAVVSLPALLTAALPKTLSPPGLDVYLYQEGAPRGEALVAYFPSPLRLSAAAPLAEEEVRAGLFKETRQTVGGDDWTIVVKPVESYVRANVRMAAWGIFAIGILLTLWLTQYLVSSHARTKIIERAIAERTAELRKTNDALQGEIREREEAERELRAAKERAEFASRAKSDFLAMMSHELRTPLNAVIGFSEILSAETLGSLGNAQYRSYAEDIRESGQALLSRINDILDLTSLDGNDFALQEEPLDLAALFEAVMPLVEDKAAAAELTLKAAIPPDLPPLAADARALKQVLLNLLSNAIKFTPAGGWISVGAEVDAAGRLILAVSDNGVGIQTEYLAQMLQPFSQADNSLARKFEGTGLGLALAQRLAQLHGAQLEIDSAVGAGTTVRVIFPAPRVLRDDATSKTA